MDRASSGHKGAMLVDSQSAVPVRPALVGPETLSFEDVYEEHVTFVWRSARRLGVSESALDDVVQEIFLVVHRRLREFEGRSSLKTWLFAILLRVVRDHRRTVRRKSPHLAQQGATDPDTLTDRSNLNPHEAVARAEGLKLLHDILDTLDQDKREIFVLAELEQLAAPDIAEATGVNVNTVYTRLRAARHDFNTALSRHRLRDERSLT
ncbi:MAG: polymerase sigma factor RpoE [Myxococcaceae bacterium]|nr:polymerase sigma factor RpoE [Myxococcaceae bacterium]